MKLKLRNQIECNSSNTYSRMKNEQQNVFPSSIFQRAKKESRIPDVG